MMTPSTKLVWAAAFLGTVLSAHDVLAQGLTSPKDPVLTALTGRVNGFLDDISLRQTQSAFTKLLANSPLAKQTDALNGLQGRVDELETKCGKYCSFEQIGAKRIGSDLVLMRYLYKCENMPVVWNFVFYRPNASIENGWCVLSVRFDSNLEALWGP